MFLFTEVMAEFWGEQKDNGEELTTTTSDVAAPKLPSLNPSHMSTMSQALW
jgi:hypothetical protein